MLCKCFQKTLPILLLCTFYASFAFAAVDHQTNPPQNVNTLSLWSLPTIGSPVPALIDFTSESFKGLHVNLRSETNREESPLYAPFPDSTADFAAKYFGERSIFTFYDDKDIKWSLIPLSDKFTMKPLTYITNVELLLEFKY